LANEIATVSPRDVDKARLLALTLKSTASSGCVIRWVRISERAEWGAASLLIWSCCVRRVLALTLQEKYRQNCHQGFGTPSIKFQLDWLIVIASL
jgi:hypothetical protein